MDNPTCFKDKRRFTIVTGCYQNHPCHAVLGIVRTIFPMSLAVPRSHLNAVSSGTYRMLATHVD
jgi:hypothetical protein